MNMFNITPCDCLTSSQEIKQWYEKNYHSLSLNGLWLKGGELNTMDPSLFTQAELRFLVCRLSTYRDVSASISHGLVAQIAQEVEGVFTDFAFLPPPKDTEVMTTSKIPLWVGTTTKEPPCAFDVLGISNSVVLELLNLPKLLHFSGIPLFKNERMMRQEIPIEFCISEETPVYEKERPFTIYYDDPAHSVKLLKGDCITILNQARENSADMIFADPPYFLSNGGITCHAGKMVSVNKGKWDKSRGVKENHKFEKYRGRKHS